MIFFFSDPDRMAAAGVETAASGSGEDGPPGVGEDLQVCLV